MIKKGFTLIELIVVIAILSVLGLLLTTQVSGYIQSAKAVTCKNNRQLIQRSVIIADGSNTSSITTLEQVAAIPGSLYRGGDVCPDGNQNIVITNRTVTCNKHKDTAIGGSENEKPEAENGFCVASPTQQFCTNMSIRNFASGNNENPKVNSVWFYEGKYYFFRADGGWLKKNPTKEQIKNIIKGDYTIEINSEEVVSDYLAAKKGDLALIDGKLKIYTAYGNTDDTTAWREIDVTIK